MQKKRQALKAEMSSLLLFSMSQVVNTQDLWHGIMQHDIVSPLHPRHLSDSVSQFVMKA